MRIPAKILIWSVVLLAPTAAFAQRGGGTRSRGEFQIGGRGMSNRGEVRGGGGRIGVPIYYEPIPFAPAYYPYTYPYSYPYTVVSTLPTYSLAPAPTSAASVPAPVAVGTPADVQALSSQVQALTAEVERLRSEREQRSAAPPEPAPAPRNTTLVFRDSHRMEVQSYAIIEQTIRVLDKDNPARIALADLDLDATRRVNQENGIRFAVPSAR